MDVVSEIVERVGISFHGQNAYVRDLPADECTNSIGNVACSTHAG